jgi:hypothetical protein
MKIFSEIQRIDPLEDGTIKAYGYASAPIRDGHGEIVTAQAMANAIDDYMRFPAVREMHDATKAAGRCLEINLDDNDRTAFMAHIVDPIAVQKVKAGVYNGFSIGGRIKRRNPQDPSIIQEILLTEVSLVDRPSCPAATLDLWKRDEGGPLGEEHRALMNGASRLQKASEDEDSDPSDLGPGVDDFEDKGIWDDGFDPKPEGPTSVASGGPYRSRVPERGSDAGDASMPTNPNERKSPVEAGRRNATQDTGHESAGGSTSAQSHGYFSGIPGANKVEEGSPLQELFRQISEMYAASHKPPVEGAEPVFEKREFSADQRRAAAKSGAAMRDGSYPIENKSDLANAIRAIGRAKNPAAAKAHIKSRARAMGATSMLPEDWGKSAESEGGLNNKQVTPAKISHLDGDNDSLATRLGKSNDLLQTTLSALERLEVRNRRGKATPEAYRLAKAYKEMDVDALAEVLAADALEKIASNDKKVADATSEAKRFKEDNEALLKQLEDTNKGLEMLAVRLQKLEAQPMPTKTAGSVHVDDNDRQQQFTADAIAKAKAAFEDMTEEQRGLLLTKVALQHPRHMNLSPRSSPPRSVGGTAGLEDVR